MQKRIIQTESLEEDQKIESHLRPQLLEDYVGQRKAKETLKIYNEAVAAHNFEHPMFDYAKQFDEVEDAKVAAGVQMSTAQFEKVVGTC